MPVEPKAGNQTDDKVADTAPIRASREMLVARSSHSKLRGLGKTDNIYDAFIDGLGNGITTLELQDEHRSNSDLSMDGYMQGSREDFIDDPCALVCRKVNMHEDQNLPVVLSPRVHDGTRCTPGQLDMCINGVCQVRCGIVSDQMCKLLLSKYDYISERNFDILNCDIILPGNI